MTMLQKYDLAGHKLANRFVMAPMTRARRPDYIANEETAIYYRQRASAGLIITEGTPVSPEGQGYINVPGIWSAEQTAGWKLVTNSVHEAGSTLFAQLWHVGRMSHTSLQPNSGAPVSSTNTPARNPKSMVFTYKEDGTVGFVEPSIPRALTTKEVARVTADFTQAARHADIAGFDGVELHAANGYLFEQFLNPILNDRTDGYGGSIENRARFTLETIDALIEVLGSNRVGIRLAPHNQQFDMQDYDGVEDTYFYLADQLESRGVAYIHLNDNWAAGQSVIDDEFLNKFRQHFSGTIILAGAMTFERAEQLIEAGIIDLPAFGQPFIANPDLVERYRDGIPLAVPERATYYGGGNEGYIDYPRATAG